MLGTLLKVGALGGAVWLGSTLLGSKKSTTSTWKGRIREGGAAGWSSFDATGLAGLRTVIDRVLATSEVGTVVEAEARRGDGNAEGRVKFHNGQYHVTIETRIAGVSWLSPTFVRDIGTPHATTDDDRRAAYALLLERLGLVP